ncbi:alpha/beta-hydrolase [Rozella allomycis CSF55]|uniref:Alpha/beta-hydrolase n=1 Tax=Rozella allomycis (strain CSF55) TaxID=988480 RepID=A0A075B0Z0_ROZAC|nr:Lipase, class 3 domain-containing protein [Rozella allomycis CSF55]RKP21546.1 alpha/beta-hydrolase [Rozella allomycis CSF55]|eukprot:EPZ34596.1 Lipase, class 3 domain-containing protein [Rozella allomycis CSF55]
MSSCLTKTITSKVKERLQKYFLGKKVMTEEQVALSLNKLLSKDPVTDIEVYNPEGFWSFLPKNLLEPELLHRMAFYNGLTYCASESEVQGVFNNATFRGKRHFASKSNMLNWIELDGLKSITKNKDLRVMIAENPRDKTLVIAFRGSSNLDDYIANFNSEPVQFGENNTDTRFPLKTCPIPVDGHSRWAFEGFLNKLPLDILRELSFYLIKAFKNHMTHKVVITGHSLGGALALFFALYMKLNYPEFAVSAIYTYGQPVIGSTFFTEWMANCIGVNKIVRVVSENDIVPWVRSNSQQSHPANMPEIYVPNANENKWIACKGSLDPKCSIQTKCDAKDWTTHRFYGGLFAGEQLCKIFK